MEGIYQNLLLFSPCLSNIVRLRKQWLLFPPEENLFPSRIPYEESSVYSKLNFFSPNPDWIKGT